MGAVVGVRGLGVELLRATGAILLLGVVSQDSYAGCSDLSQQGWLAVCPIGQPPLLVAQG